MVVEHSSHFPGSVVSVIISRLSPAETPPFLILHIFLQLWFVYVYVFLVHRFTNFDFTKPRRMSYYPHNQPHMHAGEVDEDGEPSFDMPRSSSQTHPGSTQFTNSQNGAVGVDSALYVPRASGAAERETLGSPQQQEYGVAISTPNTPPGDMPRPMPIPALPTAPDSVYVRSNSLGSDPAAVQPLPRLSSGSRRS